MDKEKKINIVLLVSDAHCTESLRGILKTISKKQGAGLQIHCFDQGNFLRMADIEHKMIIVDASFFQLIQNQKLFDRFSPIIYLQTEQDGELSKEDSSIILEVLPQSEMNEYVLGLMLRRAAEEIQRNRFLDDQRIQKINHENLIKSISSILIGLNKAGQIVLWNRVAESIFRIKTEDALGKRLEDCSIDWEESRVLKAIHQTLIMRKHNRLDDVVLKQKDKEILLGFTLNPFVNHTSEDVAILLYGADITEKVKARKALQESNERLKTANEEIAREKAKDQAILASIGDGLVVTDDLGNIILVNKQARLMFEWVQKDVKGQKLIDIIPLLDETGSLITSEARPSVLAFKTKNKCVCFANYCQSENNLIPLQISSAPVIFEEKQIGAITLFRNISREKEIDNMKSEFVSTVSHELRTPLTSIREGVAQVFEELLGPINEDQKEFLTIAMDEIDRLAAIINDLLDISKIESGGLVLRKSWVDFADLLRPVIFNYKNLTKSKEIELTSKLPSEEMVEIYCDPDKIKQIITNLLTNAYKFTHKGGKIEVEVINEERQITIAIRDTGVGITEENLPKIFQKFLQVGRTAGPGIKGTGLGLTICKHLIELHSGKIWVESKKDVGSCFYFTLPKLEKDFAAKENIEHGLEDLSQNSNLSLIMFKLNDLKELSPAKPDLKPHTLLKSFMKKMIRGPINGLGDIFLNGANECIIILPGVKKDEAKIYAEKFKNALLKNMIKLSAQLEPIYQVDMGVSSFPEDAESSENLLKQARIAIEGIDVEDGSERRIQKRADYEMNLNVLGCKGELIKMHSIDISEGGLQLATSEQQVVGRIFEIKLNLPGQETMLNLKSLVVWVRKSGEIFLVGVKFLEATEGQRNTIRNFIDIQHKKDRDGGTDLRKSA